MPEIVKSIEINLKSAFQASNLESEFRQKCRIIDIKTGNILSEKGWLDLFTGVWMELFCWWNSPFEEESPSTVGKHPSQRHFYVLHICCDGDMCVSPVKQGSWKKMYVDQIFVGHQRPVFRPPLKNRQIGPYWENIPCEPSKGFVSKSGERERAWESQREPERGIESQRALEAPERARESQREPCRGRDYLCGSLWLSLWLSLALSSSLWLSDWISLSVSFSLRLSLSHQIKTFIIH